MSKRAADAARLRETLRKSPGDRIAWHNLAAAEGDIGRPREAELAARRAIALGLKAPETRLVLARALQAQRRLDEAEREFEEALRQRAAYIEAHRDYAQLRWMRTGNVESALRAIDRALSHDSRNPGLHLVRSIVLEHATDTAAALAASRSGLDANPDDPELLAQAAHLCMALGETSSALRLAERAVKTAGDVRARTVLAEALIAAGDLGAADPVLTQLRSELPANQYVIALSATLWRLTGDARYPELCADDALVATRMLEPPSGFGSLDAFLAAVESELASLHQFVSHPFHQSVRGGGQITLHEHDLTRPLLRALFASIGNCVHSYLQALGPGADPMRARNTGRGQFTGAWSVRLTSGGSHADHVHPHGWLSSACYIALPSTLTATAAESGKAGSHAGWLRFGRPAIPTAPPLAADRFVQPVPGRLVLFPAYMWHGVEPFVGDRPRLSVAFDVVPA